MAKNPLELLAADLKLLGRGADPQAQLDALLTEWKGYFTESQFAQITVDKLNAWKADAEAYFASPTRARELELLERASKDPVEGMGIVLTSIPAAMGRSVQRWWNFFFSEQTPSGFTDGKIQYFKVPQGTDPNTSHPKFLIISDLHRDDAINDDCGMFQRGSIDHFRYNVKLYERVLDWASAGGYTLIEAGDCEELWFVRDVATYPRVNGTLDIATKLHQIITSHPTIYSRLRTLHGDGRYFRMYGNHDSFLKPDDTGNDSVFQVLKKEMETGLTNKPFQIYDAFVIEGVKTMLDHSSIDVVLEIGYALGTGQTPAALLDQLLLGRLGMDSNDYTQRTNLLVTHGHQFDFWNCPENEILGLLNANTVGMLIDRNMDPFLDIRGFAMQGNPLIDFADIFSSWPFFNSFLSSDQARRFAHQIQHATDSERMLRDGIAFSETMAAMQGAFGIALNYRDPTSGVLLTPAQSRAELGLDTWGTASLETLPNVAEYLRRHHFNLISIGHTHAPHSQSYFTLDNMSGLSLFLAPLEEAIQLFLPDMLEPTFKSTYLNSGTAGWMEGVIWAVEVDHSGQARLVYWTDNSVGPEYMDWELQPFPKLDKEQMQQGLDNALAEASTAIDTQVDIIQQEITERLTELKVGAEQIADALRRRVALSIDILAGLILFATQQAERAYEQLQEVPDALKGYYERAKEELQQELDKIRSFRTDVMMGVKRRAFFGFDETEAESFVIRAPIGKEERERLERYQKLMVLVGIDEVQALHYGGMAAAAFGNFPRNMPFFSGFDPRAALQQSNSPVLDSLLSTLWMYPPAGQIVDVKGVAINSLFELKHGEVKLTVMLTKGTPVVDPPLEDGDTPPIT